MKKLSLKNLNLEAENMLLRKQLKTIFGGDGGYGGNICAGNITCSHSSQCNLGCKCVKTGPTQEQKLCIIMDGVT